MCVCMINVGMGTCQVQVLLGGRQDFSPEGQRFLESWECLLKSYTEHGRTGVSRKPENISCRDYRDYIPVFPSHHL